MYNPNVCTPTMFEDELRALTAMTSFADPQLDARLEAVGQLRRAIAAVREVPGWSGDSATGAENALSAMEKNASTIEDNLRGMRSALIAATDTAAREASGALGRLPSASAEGLLADAGRNLADLTDGLGVFDTGEAVAREEARLAAERETAAMNELKKIRSTLVTEARGAFEPESSLQVPIGEIPPPVIDVDDIDARVPPVGSNAPSGGPGTSPGGSGIGTWTAPSTGGWVPDGSGSGGDGGSGGGNGGSGGGDGGSVGDNDFGNGGDGGSVGDNGWGNGGNGGTGGSGSGGAGDPSVDSPIGGNLPGYPGGGGSGSGGGLLSGGSGGSGMLGAAVVGGAGAAALMGARSASLGGASGASLFGGGGSGAGAGAGAATAGRGLLGMSGATGPGGFGAAGSASGSASGAAGGSAAGAGGRSMAPGMMGGASGDDDKRRERSGLGGPIAPKLEDDEETGPRSRSAQAGSRDTLR